MIPKTIPAMPIRVPTPKDIIDSIFDKWYQIYPRKGAIYLSESDYDYMFSSNGEGGLNCDDIPLDIVGRFCQE